MAYVPPHRRQKGEAGSTSSKQPNAPNPPSTPATHSRFSLTRPPTSTPHRYTRHTPHNHERSQRRHPHSNDRSRPRPRPRAQHRPSTALSWIDHVRCINLDARTDKWQTIQSEWTTAVHNDESPPPLHRFSAIDGSQPQTRKGDENNNDICRDWDATNNARYSRSAQPGPRRMTDGEVGCALSHVALWRTLVADTDTNDATTTTTTEHDTTGNTIVGGRPRTMLILEDDAVLYQRRGESRFVEALDSAMAQLPVGWDLLYLGFSSRGARTYLDDDTKNNGRGGGVAMDNHTDSNDRPDAATDAVHVRLYRPEYGYHTHAYVLTRRAAAILLAQCPVTGPVDVWLADHKWFNNDNDNCNEDRTENNEKDDELEKRTNLSVWCAVVAGEGWRRPDGTYEGASLVSQNRAAFASDIVQSSTPCKTSTYGSR